MSIREKNPARFKSRRGGRSRGGGGRFAGRRGCVFATFLDTMDHLLEAYASSSSDDDELATEPSAASALGELPPELRNIFKDSGAIDPLCLT